MLADATKRRLLAAMVMIVATPALGAWPYARWGMSPQQVVASSSGEVALDAGTSDDALRDPNIKVRAVGTRTLGKWRLRTVFYFTNDRLGEIKAKVLNPNGCGGLSAHLSRAHGKPFLASHEDGVNSDFWRDAPHRTIVHLMEIGTSCWVEYNPLTTASVQRIRAFYSARPANPATPPQLARSAQWANCMGRNGRTASDSISACSAIIAGGRETTRSLAYGYYSRAGWYDQAGAHAKAVADYSEAIRLVPGYSKAYFGRAHAALAMGRDANYSDDMARAKDLIEDGRNDNPSPADIAPN